MIEVIYNEEEEMTIDKASLPEPKNVRQVGEPREYKKIFIEDYVHTFLQQYSAGKEEKTRVAILLGNSERLGGKRHLYIKSALPVENVQENQGKYNFTEKVWGRIYSDCENYFPHQEIMGWFLSTPGFAVNLNGTIEETHRTYFSGADKVLFMLEPLEGESAFFGFDGNRFVKQSGYYIYYEKNEPMREFIMQKNEKEKQNFSGEKPDVAMANFRKILKEKKEQTERRKKQAVSYGMKVTMVLILFVSAVALKNQSDKIAAMEQQMTDGQITEAVEEASSDDVLVEELPGEVEEQPKNLEEQPEVVYEEPTEPQEPEEEEQIIDPARETAAEAVSYQEYTVKAGDTLAKISRDFYGTDEKISEICSLNGITDDNYIQAGEIILLP